MPGRCIGCRGLFSVWKFPAIPESMFPHRKLVISIHLGVANLKSASSVMLNLNLGVSQPTTWIKMQSIRGA